MKSTVRQFPMPQHPNSGKYGWCKWCGETIPKVIDGKASSQRMWHPACAHQFNLHTRLETQRDHVIERDGQRCALCPEGTPEPMRWLRGQVITVYQPMPGFKHLAPVGSDEWLRLVTEWRSANPPPQYQDIERVSALELDHRVPLWSVADLPDEERRPFFGPLNLWLLCNKHHLQKSARETAERAAQKRFVRAQLTLI